MERPVSFGERLAARVGSLLERRLSRRGALARAALAGSAFAVAPVRYLVRPETAWAVIDSIVKAFAESTKPPEEYAPGTWGPKAAMDLIESDGRRWLHTTDGEAEPIVACSL